MRRDPKTVPPWRQGTPHWRSWRTLTAATVGVGLYVGFFRRFLPYDERNRLEPNLWWFAALAFVVSASLAAGTRWPGRIPTSLLAGTVAAYMTTVAIDSVDDRDHNIWPIGLALFAALCLPGYLDTWLVSTLKRGK